MSISKDFDPRRLSVDDRLSLIEVLWDSLSPEDVPIPEWHKQELDKRMKSYEAGEMKTYSWEEVKQRLKLDE